MSLKGLSDRVTLVTGGASGIGLATATRLVQEGGRVALVDLDADACVNAAEQLGGAHVVAIAADVAQEEDVVRAFEEAATSLGRIDSLHNCAGIEGQAGPLVSSDVAQFDALVRVNLRGSYLCLREMLRRAEAQQSPATIVNTSSGTALHGVPGMGQYAATKAAIIALTRNAAIESARSGTRVNVVVPGPIETPLFDRLPEQIKSGVEAALPVGRVGRVEEAAAVIVWLLSDESPYVTGAVYTVDGGETAA